MKEADPRLRPQITCENGDFVLRASVHVPRPLSEVFAFFSDAHNLEHLTPPMLKFVILTSAPIEMHVGTKIDYRLKIHGVPVRWRSEITYWEPPVRFEDTQLKGPYRKWVHEHRFASEGEGTRMEDTVRYRVFGGKLVNRLFVRRDVLRIFAYRNRMLLSHFQKFGGADARGSLT